MSAKSQDFVEASEQAFRDALACSSKVEALAKLVECGTYLKIAFSSRSESDEKLTTLYRAVLRDQEAIAEDLKRKLSLVKEPTIELQKSESSANFEELSNANAMEPIGLENEKIILRSIVEGPLRQPEVVLEFGIQMLKRNVLLFGLPGCGKTLLVRWLAKKCNCNFLPLSGWSLLSKCYEETQKTIAAAFAEAQRKKPCLIFFDDVDLITRDGESDVEARKIVGEIQRQMTDLGNSKDVGVFVFAATSKPWAMDSAMLKKFDTKVHITFPTPEDRISIIDHFLKQSNHSLAKKELEQLAEVSRARSTSEIINSVVDALNYNCQEASIFDPQSRQKVKGQFMMDCGQKGNSTSDEVKPGQHHAKKHCFKAVKAHIMANSSTIPYSEISAMEDFAASQHIIMTLGQVIPQKKSKKKFRFVW